MQLCRTFYAKIHQKLNTANFTLQLFFVQLFAARSVSPPFIYNTHFHTLPNDYQETQIQSTVIVVGLGHLKLVKINNNTNFFGFLMRRRGETANV